jgi:DNA-directed RNA polymerase specialized sigma24 family protein
VSQVIQEKLDRVVASYGDLIFDLCDSILGSTALAQIAFYSIIKKIRSEIKRGEYQLYERSWILKVASQHLISMVQQRGEIMEPKLQIEIDSQLDSGHRLKYLGFYFRRLRPEMQLLLLLKDKHQVSHEDISAALSTPVDTLKLQREQVLKTLEEWMWTSY